MWQRWHSPLTKYWVRDPQRRHGSGWNGPPGQQPKQYSTVENAARWVPQTMQCFW